MVLTLGATSQGPKSVPLPEGPALRRYVTEEFGAVVDASVVIKIQRQESDIGARDRPRELHRVPISEDVEFDASLSAAHEVSLSRKVNQDWIYIIRTTAIGIAAVAVALVFDCPGVDVDAVEPADSVASFVAGRGLINGGIAAPSIAGVAVGAVVIVHTRFGAAAAAISTAATRTSVVAGAVAPNGAAGSARVSFAGIAAVA